MRLRCAIVVVLAGSAGCHATPKAAVVPADAPAETAPELAPPVRVGDRFPTIHLRAIDGREAEIVPRRVTIMVVWATWSEPGKKALLAMQDLHARHAVDGVTVLGLSIDDERAGVAAAVQTWKVSFPVAWDRDHTVATRLRVATEPTIYVIDPTGIVRFVNAGYRQGAADVIEQEALSLLPPR